MLGQVFEASTSLVSFKTFFDVQLSLETTSILLIVSDKRKHPSYTSIVIVQKLMLCGTLINASVMKFSATMKNAHDKPSSC